MQSETPMNILAYIAAMPKVELHLHLEGCIAGEDMLYLADRNGLRLDAVPGAGQSPRRMAGFDDFKRILLKGVRLLRKPEDFHYLVERLGARLAQQNVVYAEVFWSPEFYRHLGHDTATLFEAMHSAARRVGEVNGVRINWIPDIIRSRGAYAREVMDWATSDSARERGVVALGLAGPEEGGASSCMFAEIFAEARARGLPSNPHAGEGTSPGQVREALACLSPARIGHGVSAVEDADLVAVLAARAIPLEVCPTSNLCLGLYPAARSHPLKALMDAGCRVTINTDDPAIFSTDLCAEYLLAVRDCGISLVQLEQAALDAVRASYLPGPEKEEMLAAHARQYAELKSRPGDADTRGRVQPASVTITGPAAETGRVEHGDTPATDLDREREEQRRWRLRDKYAGIPIFDRLVDNEFLEPEELLSRQAVVLRKLIDYSVARVPYYRELFSRCNLRPGDISSREDLVKLPLLDKRLVRDNFDRLRTRRLPPGETLFKAINSSGTTGRPVRILQTYSNNVVYHYLNQRHYRWYRFDPAGLYAFIRLASQLPLSPDGGLCTDGETIRLDHWRYVGSFFHTGPWLGFNVTNPVRRQLQWLETERPDYLASYAESLEHLCFASGGANPADSIRGSVALSEQLTPAMRRRIDSTFDAPVHQGYGLSEIGMVAVECHAGRFHVHAEHCILEIIDDEGVPCRPGATGRIIVTALNNLAMPLIRYDTDDLGVAISGPCPCGRTLPSFGGITGRYSRIAYLPEGTLTRVAAVRDTIETMPNELVTNFYQYQLHQFRDNSFELRLVTTGRLDKEFKGRIESAWNNAAGGTGGDLSIVEVDEIPRTPGGKLQEFTSDHMPAAGTDDDPPSETEGR